MTFPFALYETATGKVLGTGSVAYEEDLALQAREGQSVYFGTARIGQRIVDGVAIDCPDTELERAKALTKQQVEFERIRRTALPIEMDEVQLDADATAQSNIKDKLVELTYRLGQGIPMPAELLFWRDYNNNMLVFSSQTEYQAWLGRLSIAITERGTRNYVWCWSLKAHIDACATLSELQTLDWA